MAKDDADIEWRLVATKSRESCRWQATDNSWISLSLGVGGDITKVVVAASDGRSEIVEGYEQGLNVARRWRQEWKLTNHAPPMSSSSGPWLPPLPGPGTVAARTGEHAPLHLPDEGPSSIPEFGGRSAPTAPGPAGASVVSGVPGGAGNSTGPGSRPRASVTGTPTPPPASNSLPPTASGSHNALGSRMSQAARPLSRNSSGGPPSYPPPSDPPPSPSPTPNLDPAKWPARSTTPQNSSRSVGRDDSDPFGKKPVVPPRK